MTGVFILTEVLKSWQYQCLELLFCHSLSVLGRKQKLWKSLLMKRCGGEFILVWVISTDVAKIEIRLDMKHADDKRPKDKRALKELRVQDLRCTGPYKELCKTLACIRG